MQAGVYVGWKLALFLVHNKRNELERVAVDQAAIGKAQVGQACERG